MREAQTDGRFALEPLDRTVVLDAMRPDHLDRDLAEEITIPGAVRLVAGTGAERIDDDEAAIDLLTAPQVPSRRGVGLVRWSLDLGQLLDHVSPDVHGVCPRRENAGRGANRKRELLSEPPLQRKAGPIGSKPYRM